MRFKRVLTMLTVLGAVGSAFAGNANVKQLLLNEGWYRNSDMTEPVSTAVVNEECLGGSEIVCAYFFSESAGPGDGIPRTYAP